MASVKRFYLCNLIPLWEIDEENLDVDWALDEVRADDLVELRVAVRDMALNLEAPDFTVQLDIYESDFLLSGGLNDHILTITSEPSSDNGAEHRPLRVLALNAPPPQDQQHHIFVNPTTGGEGEGVLLRAYWKATWQDDVAGHPEYFFDVTLTVEEEDLEERSDRELTVLPAGTRFGMGLGLAGADLVAAEELFVPPAPTVVAAGWAAGEVRLGETVDLLAVVEGGQPGQRLTFEIMRSGGHKPDVLETVVVALQEVPLQRVSWQMPSMLPVQGLNKLGLRVYVYDDEVFEAQDGAGALGQSDLQLFGQLAVRADLELELVDARGQPLQHVAYVLKDGQGQVVHEGSTMSDGKVRLRDLPDHQYMLEVEGLTVLSAEQPPRPAAPLPTENVVFSFVDARLPE